MRIAARPTASLGRRGWLPVVAAGAAMLLLGALAGRLMAPRGERAPAMVRATLDLGDSTVIRPIGNVRLAIAPSGRRVAFIGNDERTRPSGSASSTSRALAGFPTPGEPSLPSSRPMDSRFGFFTAVGGHTAMKVIRVGGGVARTVVQDSVASFGGADWADDGRIYFTHSSRGLARVAATGGAVTRISTPDSANGVNEHDYPDVLPGSRQAFVMLWRGSIGANRVGVVDLGSGAVSELAEGSYPRYLAPGRIVIGASDGRVLVAPFDAHNSRLSENPVLMLDDAMDELSNGTVQFAVSENGTFVYQPKQGGMDGLVWVDRSGQVVPIDTTLRGYFSFATLSPDGTQIAVARSVSGGGQIWVKQLRTGAFSRVSQDLQDANRPVWTPDGRYVAFLATKDLHRTAWIARADGSDSPRPIARGAVEYDEVGFDRTGRYTLFRSEGSASGTRYLLVLESGMDSAPRILLKTRNDHYAMTLSPNGRWLAYTSDESGNAEVYVRPFPSVDSAKFAISVGGGWGRCGAATAPSCTSGTPAATCTRWPSLPASSSSTALQGCCSPGPAWHCRTSTAATTCIPMASGS